MPYIVYVFFFLSLSLSLSLSMLFFRSWFMTSAMLVTSPFNIFYTMIRDFSSACEIHSLSLPVSESIHSVSVSPYNPANKSLCGSHRRRRTTTETHRRHSFPQSLLTGGVLRLTSRCCELIELQARLQTSTYMQCPKVSDIVSELHGINLRSCELVELHARLQTST